MNITQQQLEADILHWITNFVEVPHPALGGWPPCPYARKARMEGTYEVRIGTNPIGDLLDIWRTGLGNREVIAIAYDPETWDYKTFSNALDFANREFLLSKDILVLEDHPDDPEIVNGVSMNQGTYALALVQCLSDLDAKAEIMARKGFYDAWPEDYLTMLFQHRKDPRK
jgi:hypothetical protein